jgi:hypothetical protein
MNEPEEKFVEKYHGFHDVCAATLRNAPAKRLIPVLTSCFANFPKLHSLKIRIWILQQFRTKGSEIVA